MYVVYGYGTYTGAYIAALFLCESEAKEYVDNRPYGVYTIKKAPVGVYTKIEGILK